MNLILGHLYFYTVLPRYLLKSTLSLPLSFIISFFVPSYVPSYPLYFSLSLPSLFTPLLSTLLQFFISLFLSLSLSLPLLLPTYIPNLHCSLPSSFLALTFIISPFIFSFLPYLIMPPYQYYGICASQRHCHAPSLEATLLSTMSQVQVKSQLVKL